MELTNSRIESFSDSSPDRTVNENISSSNLRIRTVQTQVVLRKSKQNKFCFRYITPNLLALKNLLFEKLEIHENALTTKWEDFMREIL